jgi:hypothetical protein
MNEDSYRLLVTRRRHTNFGITTSSDKDIIEDVQRKFPNAVTLARSAGDWSLGFSQTELRFRDFDPHWPHLDMVVTHYATENNPVGPNFGIFEWLAVPDVDIDNVRALRDALNKVLREDLWNTC